MYSNKIAEAYVDVKANTKQYEQGVSKIGKSLKGLAIAATLAIATKKIYDFGKASLQVATEFDETRNRFKVIFNEVGKDAEEAANRIADSFDLASGTSKTLLSNTGDLLTGFGFAQDEALEMAEAVATLGGDLASWSNISGGAEEASRRLTSAMLGETEATKALGIKIDQQSKEFRDQVKEIEETTGKTSSQAKALVILAQAYKQSKNALGDYARTRDSFANQQRIVTQQYVELQDNIGKIIKLFIEQSGVMELVINKFKILNTETGKNIKNDELAKWIINNIANFKMFVNAITTNTAKIMIDIGMFAKQFVMMLKLPFTTLGTFIGHSISNLVDAFDGIVAKLKVLGLKIKKHSPFAKLTKEDKKNMELYESQAKQSFENIFDDNAFKAAGKATKKQFELIQKENKKRKEMNESLNEQYEEQARKIEEIRQKKIGALKDEEALNNKNKDANENNNDAIDKGNDKLRERNRLMTTTIENLQKQVQEDIMTAMSGIGQKGTKSVSSGSTDSIESEIARDINISQRQVREKTTNRTSEMVKYLKEMLLEIKKGNVFLNDINNNTIEIEQNTKEPNAIFV